MGRRLLEGAPAERIAAALVRLYRARLPEPEDVSDPGGTPMREKAGRGGEARERRETGFDRNAPTGNGGVWFKLSVGRKMNADPKWLLPMICKRGGIEKRDVGAIRIFDRESKVEIAPRAAEAFEAAVKVPGPKGDNVMIEKTSAPGGIEAAGPRPKARAGERPRPKDKVRRAAG